MPRATALERAIGIIGGQGILADKLGVTSAAISQWKRRSIPARYAPRIERLTQGQVGREELRPDLYR